MKKRLAVLLFICPFLLGAQSLVVEEIPMRNGAILIPGILSYPKNVKKSPLAIFIHGSGNGDRDGNQGFLLQTDHIKLLADSLNQRGIAFYRYDKRTATQSNLPKLKDAAIQDLVADVQVAIKYFAKDHRFSGIHLIGHSQGSLIGMLATNAQVNTYTSLAGPGVSIDKIIVNQIKAQNKDLALAAQAHIKELMETDTITKVNPFLVTIFAPQNQKFLKEWIKLDPASEIKKLKTPLLLLNGDADMQVAPENVTLLQQAAPRAKMDIIPQMNHVLKTVTDLEDNKKSYRDPAYPLSTRLVQLISEFIKAHG